MILGGYLQSGESIIVKNAVIQTCQKLRKEKVDFKLVNLVHDEVEFEVIDREGIPEYVANVMCDSIVSVGEILGMNCPLLGSQKLGYNWYEVH